MWQVFIGYLLLNLSCFGGYEDTQNLSPTHLSVKSQHLLEKMRHCKKEWEEKKDIDENQRFRAGFVGSTLHFYNSIKSTSNISYFKECVDSYLLAGAKSEADSILENHFELVEMSQSLTTLTQYIPLFEEFGKKSQAHQLRGILADLEKNADFKKLADEASISFQAGEREQSTKMLQKAFKLAKNASDYAMIFEGLKKVGGEQLGIQIAEGLLLDSRIPRQFNQVAQIFYAFGDIQNARIAAQRARLTSFNMKDLSQTIKTLYQVGLEPVAKTLLNLPEVRIRTLKDLSYLSLGYSYIQDIDEAIRLAFRCKRLALLSRETENLKIAGKLLHFLGLEQDADECEESCWKISSYRNTLSDYINTVKLLKALERTEKFNEITSLAQNIIRDSSGSTDLGEEVELFSLLGQENHAQESARKLCEKFTNPPTFPYLKKATEALARAGLTEEANKIGRECLDEAQLYDETLEAAILFNKLGFYSLAEKSLDKYFSDQHYISDVVYEKERITTLGLKNTFEKAIKEILCRRDHYYDNVPSLLRSLGLFEFSQSYLQDHITQDRLIITESNLHLSLDSCSSYDNRDTFRGKYIQWAEREEILNYVDNIDKYFQYQSAAEGLCNGGSLDKAQKPALKAFELAKEEAEFRDLFEILPWVGLKKKAEITVEKYLFSLFSPSVKGTETDSTDSDEKETVEVWDIIQAFHRANIKQEKALEIFEGARLESSRKDEIQESISQSPQLLYLLGRIDEANSLLRSDYQEITSFEKFEELFIENYYSEDEEINQILDRLLKSKEPFNWNGSEIFRNQSHLLEESPQDPLSQDEIYNKALHLYHQGFVREAQEYAQDFLNLCETLKDNMCAARLYFYIGSYEDAQLQASRCQEEGVTFLHFRDLTEVFQMIGHYEGAEKTLEKAIDRVVSTEEYKDVINLVFLKGNVEEAEKIAIQAIRSAGTHELRQLSLFLFEIGIKKPAVQANYEYWIRQATHPSDNLHFYIPFADLGLTGYFASEIKNCVRNDNNWASFYGDFYIGPLEEITYETTRKYSQNGTYEGELDDLDHVFCCGVKSVAYQWSRKLLELENRAGVRQTPWSYGFYKTRVYLGQQENPDESLRTLMKQDYSAHHFESTLYLLISVPEKERLVPELVENYLKNEAFITGKFSSKTLKHIADKLIEHEFEDLASPFLQAASEKKKGCMQAKAQKLLRNESYFEAYKIFDEFKLEVEAKEALKKHSSKLYVQFKKEDVEAFYKYGLIEEAKGACQDWLEKVQTYEEFKESISFSMQLDVDISPYRKNYVTKLFYRLKNSNQFAEMEKLICEERDSVILLCKKVFEPSYDKKRRESSIEMMIKVAEVLNDELMETLNYDEIVKTMLLKGDDFYWLRNQLEKVEQFAEKHHVDLKSMLKEKLLGSSISDKIDILKFMNSQKWDINPDLITNLAEDPIIQKYKTEVVELFCDLGRHEEAKRLALKILESQDSIILLLKTCEWAQEYEIDLYSKAKVLALNLFRKTSSLLGSTKTQEEINETLRSVTLTLYKLGLTRKEIFEKNEVPYVLTPKEFEGYVTRLPMSGLKTHITKTALHMKSLARNFEDFKNMSYIFHRIGLMGESLGAATQCLKHAMTYSELNSAMKQFNALGLKNLQIEVINTSMIFNINSDRLKLNSDMIAENIYLLNNIGLKNAASKGVVPLIEKMEDFDQFQKGITFIETHQIPFSAEELIPLGIQHIKSYEDYQDFRHLAEKYSLKIDKGKLFEEILRKSEECSDFLAVAKIGYHENNNDVVHEALKDAKKSIKETEEACQLAETLQEIKRAKEAKNFLIKFYHDYKTKPSTDASSEDNSEDSSEGGGTDYEKLESYRHFALTFHKLDLNEIALEAAQTALFAAANTETNLQNVLMSLIDLKLDKEIIESAYQRVSST